MRFDTLVFVSEFKIALSLFKR